MSRATTDNTLEVRDLGRCGYDEALLIQRRVHEQVSEGGGAMTLLLMELDPVITMTRRSGIDQHLLATAEELGAKGIEVRSTDRGGDITYHGPGQLVAYPILNLQTLGLNLGRYMRLLEDVVIRTAADFGIEAFHVKGCTGVWTTRQSERAKLCALGVRIRRQVTLHGLALNVTTDLSHFKMIVPCGIKDASVTSLRELLGERSPTMAEVKVKLVRHFQEAVGR